MSGKNGKNHTANEPQVIDAATGKPDPIPPALKLLGRDLTTIRHVRRAMAKVIRAEAAGDIEHNRARGLVWMLGELAGTIYKYDLEQRIEQLEERAGSAGALSGQRQLPSRALN